MSKFSPIAFSVHIVIITMIILSCRGEGVSVSPPLSPTHLAAAVVSPFEIDLLWRDTSDNEDGFQIEISTDGTTFLARTTMPANSTGYVETGLTEGTPYWYRVRSYNTAGSSSYSHTARATTFLKAPAGLTAMAVSFSQMVLLWQDTSNREDGFEVWRSADGITFMHIATVLTNTTSYADMGLNEGAAYSYWVRAYSANANSYYSNVASIVTLLMPPTGLAAAWISFTETTLSWQDNSSAEAGYRIERSIDGTNFSEIADMPADTKTFTDSGLSKGSTYWYRVQAYNALAHSDFSNYSYTITLLWARTYGGSSSDQAVSVLETSDGRYIVAGYTNSFGAGYDDFWILKLNADGTVVWQKAYGGGGYDRARSIFQTSDGGFIAAGINTNSAWVVKLNGDGGIAWQKAYGGMARSIQQTSDGGYVMAGDIVVNPFNSDDFWVLKLDSDGEVVWQKSYGGSSQDNNTSVQQTADGGYIVAGNSYSFGGLWVLKLDSDGVIVWQKAYGGGFTPYAYGGIRQTSDGGYIIPGFTGSIGPGGYDGAILKLNPDGSVDWQKAYRGPYGDVATSVKQTGDEGYIVAGYTWIDFWTSYDFWLLKLDVNGDVVWQKRYGGRYMESPTSVQQTADGGYLVAGNTYSFGAGNYDFWVLRLASDGTINFNPSSGASSTVTTAAVLDISATVLNTGAVTVTTLAVPFTTYAIVTDTNATIRQQAP